MAGNDRLSCYGGAPDFVPITDALTFAKEADRRFAYDADFHARVISAGSIYAEVTGTSKLQSVAMLTEIAKIAVLSGQLSFDQAHTYAGVPIVADRNDI